MIHYMCSKLTATAGATATLIDTVSLPTTAKAITGLACYLAVYMTTIQSNSGICEFDSASLSLKPMQIPLQPFGATTSGAVAPELKLWPVNIPNPAAAQVTGTVTLDNSNTGNPPARFVIQYQD